MVFIAVIPAILLAGLFTWLLKKFNPRLGFSRFSFIWSFILLFGLFGMAVLHFMSDDLAQIVNIGDWLVMTVPFSIFGAILFYYGLNMAHTSLTDNEELTKKPVRNFIITVVVAWFAALSNVYVFNMAFDTAESDPQESVIKEKTDKFCKQVTIADPNMDNTFWNLRVNQELYDWARPGVSVLKYEYREGRLGIPYVKYLQKSEITGIDDPN